MKIAISVSGETRTHNHLDSNQDFHESLEKLFGDWDYDLYGHTWQHCDRPINLYKFVDFKQTNQDDIWEQFVKHNIFDRVPFRTSWNDNIDYRRLFEDDTGFLDFCKQRAAGCYGQIWSWHKTTKMITDSGKRYDFYFRWRWDNSCIDEHVDEFNDTLHHFLNNTGNYAGWMEDSNILTAYPILNGNTMHDTFFVLKELFVDHNLCNTLNNVVINNLPHRHTAHELWYGYLTELGYHIAAGLPNLRKTIIKDEYERPNKDWDI